MSIQVGSVAGLIGMHVSARPVERGDWSSLCFAPLLALAVAALALWLILRFRLAVPLDAPNDRSLHAAPTPRIGGIGVLLGVLSGWFLIDGVPGLLMILVAALAAVSFIDDSCGLSAPVRLLAHLAAGIIWVEAVGGVPFWLSTVLMVLLLVWMTNLYNFMDGANGLAGGMAVLGFGAYGLAAWQGGDTGFAATSWVVAGAAFGFLAFNLHPARVFLGDSGSIPLGFLAGALGYAGWQAALWPAWFPWLVFSLFIVDASVTLLRRFLRGEKVWRAHREHAYQRLIRGGWSHRRLAMSAYGLMMASGATALYLRQSPILPVLAGLIAWAGLYVAALLAVERRWRRRAGESA